MKTLKVKFTALSLLAIMAVSLFMTSCEQEAVPTPEVPDPANQSIELVSSEVLPEDDVRVAELRTIVDSEVTTTATPHFDMVTFVEYSEPGATAMILPYITGDMQLRWLISYFTDGEYKNSMFMSLNATEEYAQGVANGNSMDYSGEFAIYTKSGEVLTRSVISEGKVIETYENTELRGCFYSCIWWYIDNHVPRLLKQICNGSVPACYSSLVATGVVVAGIITSITAVGPGLAAAVSCTTMLGCMGAGLWHCVDYC